MKYLFFLEGFLFAVKNHITRDGQLLVKVGCTVSERNFFSRCYFFAFIKIEVYLFSKIPRCHITFWRPASFFQGLLWIKFENIVPFVRSLNLGSFLYYYFLLSGFYFKLICRAFLHLPFQNYWTVKFIER